MVHGATLTIVGHHTFCTLTVEANGSVTQVAEDAGGLDLEIETDCTVDSSSSITATGRGFAGGTGPGSPGDGVSPYSGGAAYGGDGGDGTGNPGSHASYGSVPQPTALGSGGGNYSPGGGVGGTGGGALRLTVNGVLHVAGTIAANGGTDAPYYSGGGSGGSVWLDVGGLEGAGTISADGGAAGYSGAGGGGGGGRIALDYNTNTFSGVLQAKGGAGTQVGGAGTVLTKQTSARATLSVANPGASPTAARTQLTSDVVVNATDVVVSNEGRLAPAEAQTLYSLSVSASGSVTTTVDPGSKIAFTVLTTCTVDASSSITATGRGFAGGTGPGSPGDGVSPYSGGAAYGGDGGDGTGNPGSHASYGSVPQPTALGSGGGNYSPGGGVGGTGGGALRLTVNGVLHVAGTIAANGGTDAPYYSGGGSGGSVWLDVGGLEGAGTISADGGAAGYSGAGGGGGGGRIALYYNTNTFSGVLQAKGGAGTQVGGAGTVLTKQTSARATLSVANPGASPTAARTQLTSDVVVNATDVVVSNEGRLAPAEAQTLYSLSVSASGSVTTTVDPGSKIAFTVLTTCTVDASSSITATGRGFAGGTGPGSPGDGVSPYSGGAAYGGDGGDGTGNPGSHASYGSVPQPTALGSGGGNYSPGGGVGGTGGGALRLTVNGVLHVAGTIAANGGTDAPYYSGGGSGGSVWLDVGGLEGAGTISADGGAAGYSGAGGGGGGGRIALDYNTNTFSGVLQAKGGAGTQVGGAGTVLTKQTSARATLSVANPGASPTAARTQLTSDVVVNATDVVVSNEGRLAPAEAQTLYSLSVSASGSVTTTVDPGSKIAFTVLTTCTVDASSSITATGRGFAGGTGPGSPGDGVSPYSGGAAYGGDGGDGTGNPGSHASYGSVPQPTALGSGGGNYSPGGGVGGTGGGALRLTVNGVLHVAGTIAANGGTDAPYYSGGGSGGSVWLDVGGLEGAGTISADGGAAGYSGAGGGGGGGRIALYSADCLANFDEGNQVHANGGAGSSSGGIGTTFLGYEIVANAGVEDEFAGASEPASPSASLVAGLSPLTLVPFDSIATNGAFAHTFTGLPGQVSAGRLAFRVKAGAGPGVAADRIVLGFSDGSGFHPFWTRYLGSTNGTGDPGLMDRPWATGEDTTIVLDLTSLPLVGGERSNAILLIRSRGFLDLVVRGNSGVDFALLSYGLCGGNPLAAPDPAAETLPKSLELTAAPNPFTSDTRMTFALPRGTATRLNVLDITGRRVKTLFEGDAAAGTHRVGWNGHSESGNAVRPGIYFIRLDSGGESLVRRVVFER